MLIWTVCCVAPSQEKRLVERAREKAEWLEFYSPKRKLLVKRRGYKKPIPVEYPLFNGYLFVRMMADGSDMRLFDRRINHHWIMNGGALSKVNSNEILLLRQRESDGSFDSLPDDNRLRLKEGSVIIVSSTGLGQMDLRVLKTPKPGDHVAEVSFGNLKAKISIDLLMQMAQ